VLYKTRGGRTAIAETVLWEQDLFKDAIEHVAFGVRRSESRHAWSNADAQPGFHKDPDAKRRKWRTEWLVPSQQTPPAAFQWLKLPLAQHASVADAAGQGGSAIQYDAAKPGDESLVALPLWVFSPWNVPPYGGACAGQWTARPSPVLVGHMVGCTSKHLTMRQLGWWHYDVSAVDLYLARREASMAGLQPRVADHGVVLSKAPSLPSLPSPPSPPLVLPSATHTRAFAEGTAVIVLAGHGVAIRTKEHVVHAWSVLRRYALLGLLLRRRVVLPLLPCELAPCAPRVPNPLRSSTVMLSMGDNTTCRQLPTGLGALTTTRLLQLLTSRSVEAPLEWVPTPNTSRWWWKPNRGPHRPPIKGCCHLVPATGSCVDPSGARRPLGDEPMLCTADLGRLLAEELDARRSARGTTVDATSTVQEQPPLLESHALAPEWSNEQFSALKRSEASVLVLDAHEEPLQRLPNAAWLKQRTKGGRASRIWQAPPESTYMGKNNDKTSTFKAEDPQAGVVRPATRCLGALSRSADVV
jgi:hypothetical protein